jgi:hypothetical protein
MGLLINGIKMGMPYINGVKHNAYIGGQKLWNDVPPEPVEPFSITVQDSGSFNIPLAGVNGSTSTYQPYNWIINWGDGTNQTVSGTGGKSESIPHTYTDSVTTHTIIITPNGKATQGWLNAFGCDIGNNTNSAKIKSINSQITTNMRTMAPYCCYRMFYRCTGLTSLPENLLPATTLAKNCYQYMFWYCSGLTSLPENLLPATTLADNCYYYMFWNCSKITSLPKLPATTLASVCYSNMFDSCTKITSIPSNLLPATTLVFKCYYNMFSNTGLTSIPSNLLPATTLVSNCYEGMFSNCSGLTSLPSNLLPATTLKDNCYSGMFNNTGLTSIPSNFLPTTTTLASGCYYGMFDTCTNLTNIGNINAAWFSARTPTQSRMFGYDTKITTPVTYANIPSAWKDT